MLGLVKFGVSDDAAMYQRLTEGYYLGDGGFLDQRCADQSEI